MSEYVVRYEWDEAGGWAVSVPSVQGVRTEGRTLDEARRNVREALSLFVEDAETARLIEDIHVPKRVRTAASKLKVYLGSLESVVDADIRVESRDILGVLAEGLRPRRGSGGGTLGAKPGAAVGRVRRSRRKAATPKRARTATRRK